MERPRKATTRLQARAASAACWMRWMCEAKQATTTRRGDCRMRPVSTGRTVPEPVLLQLSLQELQGERRAVHRQRELAQEVGQGADVVLVAVGEHHRLHPFLLLAEVLEVGQDQVDAGHLLMGEGQPAVD